MSIASSDKRGIEIQESPGYSVLFVDNPTIKSNIHYYDLTDQVVKELKTMNIAIPATGIVGQPFVISGLPLKASVKYPNGLLKNISDGFVDWITYIPGIYRFTISAFPYKEEEYDVEFR